MSDPARKLEPVNDDPSPLYREAPGNIEAEQALIAATKAREITAGLKRAIEDLQLALKQAGFEPGLADGQMDADTLTALYAYLETVQDPALALGLGALIERIRAGNAQRQ